MPLSLSALSSALTSFGEVGLEANSVAKLSNLNLFGAGGCGSLVTCIADVEFSIFFSLIVCDFKFVLLQLGTWHIILPLALKENDVLD